MPDSQQNNLEDIQSYCYNEGLEGTVVIMERH